MTGTHSPVPRLDDLVSAVESGSPDRLQQLTAAVLVARHLDDLGDHLVGHFVDRARESGATWALIGQSLGVTKQAAQKRFVPSEPGTAETDLRVFALYTDQARAAVVGAQQHAARSRAAEIRPGHLLLALLDDDTLHLGTADRNVVREAVNAAVGTGAADTVGLIPFAASSKKALELGHRQALRTGAEHVDAVHLLLGVLALTDSPDVVVAATAGLDRTTVETRPLSG